MSEIVTAEVIGNSVRYFDHCGGWIERTGGSENWRCNNPGAIPHGNPLRSGEISGSSGSIAIFEDYTHGVNGFQFDLAQSIANYDMSLEDWVDNFYHNLNAISICQGIDVDPSTQLSNLSEQQKTALLNEIRQKSGWEIGTQSAYHAGPGGSHQACPGFGMGAAGPGGTAPPPNHTTPDNMWHPPSY